MFSALIPAIASIIGKVVDRAIPDRDEANRLKAALQQKLLELDHAEFQAAAKVVLAEAEGSGLKAMWRPIVMLVFTGLIVARWLGFTAPGITPDLEAQLFEIIKIGLGGYIIGRSAEKAALAWRGGRGSG